MVAGVRTSPPNGGKTHGVAVGPFHNLGSSLQLPNLTLS